MRIDRSTNVLSIFSVAGVEITNVWGFINDVWGGTSGIIRTAGSPYFAVTESAPTGWSVSIAPGRGFYNSQPIYLPTASTLAIANTVGTHTIEFDGTFNVKYNAAPTAGAVWLAVLVIPVGATSILNAYLTDNRVWL